MLGFLVLLGAISVSQQCCTPTLWEGDQMTLISLIQPNSRVPQVVKGMYRIYYDAGRKMVSLNGNTDTDGSSHPTQTVQDYNSRIQYDVYDGKCTSKQLPNFAGNCIPANATRIDTYMATGSLTMPIQIYSFMQDGLNIHLSVDANCVPIGQTFYGTTNGQQMFGSTSFMNIVARSSFANSRFSTPTSCQRVTGTGLIGKRGLFKYL